LRGKATAWLWLATNPCPQLVREQVKRHIEERHTTPEMAARIATAIEQRLRPVGRSLRWALRPTRTAQRLECSNGYGPRFLANLWQMALRAEGEDALCLVELRGFEPLTPCMPLTSQPLTPQRASTRCLISVRLSTQIAMKRHGDG
jgi:hypothetical protein